MSLRVWIKSLFGITPKRDISRLTSTSELDSDATEELEERIDTSGAPIKEHHQRRGLRDKRLLPKVISPTRSLGYTKRKKIMSLQEAQRLFGATMRTRNRQLRDLITDEKQLKRYGLPIWKSEEEIAEVLGITLKQLWFFAIHREKEQQPHYVTFSIPKRSGDRRLIMAPKRRLKAIQRTLLEHLVEKLPVSEVAHAFRKEHSIATGAAPHVGKKTVMKMDLKDFFPSVTFPRVRGLLIAYGYSFPVATTLAVLMTEAQRQPVDVDGTLYHVPIGQRHCVQGAPTSPGICNAILLKLDHRLAALARKHNLDYTRYADDLTFSGDLSREEANKLRQLISYIIRDEGFTVRKEKTKIMSQGARQSVTGVTVNQTLGLSRRERRRMRACAHQLKKNPSAEKERWLKGKIAYLSMLNPDQANKFK